MKELTEKIDNFFYFYLWSRSKKELLFNIVVLVAMGLFFGQMHSSSDPETAQGAYMFLFIGAILAVFGSWILGLLAFVSSFFIGTHLFC